MKEIVFNPATGDLEILYGHLIKNASEELRNDRELALIAINKDVNNFQYLSEQLRNDRELALIAINKDVNAFYYLSEKLRNDRELLLFAIDKS